jgi:hypothetical protein
LIALVPAESRKGLREFHRVPTQVYRPWPNYRATEDELVRMLVGGRSEFHRHACVRPFLFLEAGEVVGRVALVHDRNFPDYVQAAFFEALPNLSGVVDALRETAKRSFPGVPRLVVGLNAHLNYSAGILLNHFEQPPVFGLTWTPPYYPDYFSGLTPRPLVTFRFENQGFYDFADSFGATFDPGPVKIRTMDRSQLRREVQIYTELNNTCWVEHPFWSNRTPEEDFELFHPFRFLLKEENLLFAEVNGKPVGFLLWYPDFNELVSRNDAHLGPWEVLRYHLWNPIRTVRLTEIGVLAEYRHGLVVPALFLRLIRIAQRGPYRFCEGGFIFEDNRSSIGMTLKYLSKAFGRKLEPYRRFAVFETDLS